ncbi:hypothetical protein JTE90_009346 [Oedothorax gibbosus]|uniref:Tyrosine-protein kinase ephrin type A/B receptor-like domain-containing protein n=1 Tax=Oedothorax gibbosus TaxID=931172 RepID=A0AAV6VS16_9ARAC|nr:hypothetical protein JTE90_009346 [Oedothorax gibbosus]
MFYFLCIFTLVFPYTNGQRLELNLRDVSGSKSPAKIACEPVGTEPLQNGGTDQEIQWQGSKFGVSERETLRSKLPGQVLVPDIRLSASRRYRCALMSENSDIDQKSLRSRIHRVLSASVPAESGSCRPGYRLDQDRCYPCPAGSYTSGQDTRCYQCPKDFFSSREAAASCQICPDGTKTSGPGADNEVLCLDSYIERETRDSKGKPVSKSSRTVWVIVGICVLVFLVTVWILIAIYLLCWYKDDGRGNLAKRLKKDLEKGLKRHHTYDTVAGDPMHDQVAEDRPEDHIYESISDDDDDDDYWEPNKTNDDYEVPIKRNKDRNYVEFRRKEDDHIYDEPTEPTKKPRRTSSEVLRQMPRAPPLPTKETDKKKIREREAKIKAKKKEAANMEAKRKKDEKLEAQRKAEARKKAAKAIKEARAKEEKERQAKENKQDDSDDHIYEEIRHVSVPKKPSEYLSKYSSHGFQPGFASSDERDIAKPSSS